MDCLTALRRVSNQILAVTSATPSAPQMRILTIGGEESVVGSQFGDAPVDHDGDPVGVVDSLASFDYRLEQRIGPTTGRGR